MSYVYFQLTALLWQNSENLALRNMVQEYGSDFIQNMPVGLNWPLSKDGQNTPMRCTCCTASSAVKNKNLYGVTGKCYC